MDLIWETDDDPCEIPDKKTLLKIDTKESLGRLSYNCHSMGYHNGTIKYGYRALRRTCDWSQLNPKEQFSTSGLVLMMTDSFASRGKHAKDPNDTKSDHDEALKFFLGYIEKFDVYITQTIPSYELFREQPSPNWNYIWLEVKASLADHHECKKLSIVRIAKKFRIDLAQRATWLRKEINQLLGCKIVHYEQLANTGCDLIEFAEYFTDKALGMLAFGIANYWGSEEEELKSLAVIRKAIKVLEVGVRTSEFQHINPRVSIIYAMLSIWQGLTLSKIYQTKAAKDLEFAQNGFSKSTTSKKDETDAGSNDLMNRLVPAIASLDIRHEEAVAKLFIAGVDLLYGFVRLPVNDMKEIIDHIGPALVTLTMRLVSLKLSILGDQYNMIRSWYATFILAKRYNMQFLALISGTELMKLIPGSTDRIMANLEDTKSFFKSNFANKLTPAFQLYKIELAQAVICYKQKQYKTGLQHIRAILDFYKKQVGKEHVDINCHLMCDTHFILAQYKCVVESSVIAEILGEDHKHLVEMSPGAIVRRLCQKLTTLMVYEQGDVSGWNILAHNLTILQSLWEAFPVAIEMSKKAGKGKDTRILASECIYYAQQFGLIGRTIQILLPIIELEMQFSAFSFCLTKIDIVLKLFDAVKPSAGKFLKVTSTTSEAVEKLKKFGIDSKVSDLVKVVMDWQLPVILMPESHYGHGDGRFEWSNINKFEDDLHSFCSATVPIFLLHSWNCTCYCCRHPFLMTMAIRFLIIQARYSCYAKQHKQTSILMRSAKHYILRVIARTVLEIPQMAVSMKVIIDSEASARVILESMYNHLFYQISMQYGLTLMEIVPFQNITTIISAYRFLMEVIKQYGGEPFAYQYPVELVTSAIFSYLVYTKQIIIRGNDFRENFRQKAIAIENDPAHKSETPPGYTKRTKPADADLSAQDMMLSTPPEEATPSRPVVCQTPAKRGRGRPRGRGRGK